MLKKLFLILLVVAPLSVVAQDKLAYINAGEIFQKMPELKDVESKLATKQETIRKNAAAIEDEFNKKVDQFQKDSAEVTPSIVADRQTQLEQLQKRYQDFLQTSQTEMEKEQQTLMAPLQQKMLQAIKDVGDENGYSYIFDRAALLYTSNSAVDASSKVKAKLSITD